MRNVTKFPPFRKGVITDRVGVDGALLESLNFVPQRGGDYWSLRPPIVGLRMSSVDTIPSVNSPVKQALTAADAVQVAPVASQLAMMSMIEPSTGVYRLSAVAIGAPFSLLLTQYATDQAGTAIPLTGANNNLGGPVDVGQASMQYAQEVWSPAKFVRGAVAAPSRWAGNVKGTDRVTGTVSGTAGASVITIGGGGSFDTTAANTDAGMYVYINAATVRERAFRIVQVLTSSTAIVDAPFGATFAGVGCRISRVGWWSVKPGTFGGGTNGTWSAVASFAHLNARCVCTHQGVTFAGNVVDNDGVYYPDRLRNSHANADYSGQWKGAELWDTNAYVDIEPGVGGQSGIQAIISNGTDLLIFKELMVFALRGAVSADGVDLGARVERVLENDGLAGGRPVATPSGVVFLGRNGVYRIGSGTVENLTVKTGIRKLFQTFAPSQVGYVDGRLFVVSRYTYAEATGGTYPQPNVLVWDDEYQLWYAWSTPRLIAPVQAGSQGAYTLIDAGDVGGGEVTPIVDRMQDVMVSGVDNYQGNSDTTQQIPYVLRFRTHPLKLSGEVRGRVRAVHVLAQIVDGNNANPLLKARVQIGNDGTDVADDSWDAQSAFGPTTDHAEQWRRMPLRGGCPPGSSMRIALIPSYSAFRMRIYAVGVEHVSVARTL